MKQGLIFASARAKAKELNLFSEERLHRMTEAKNIDDAVRILAEANYGGGMNVTSYNFYDVLAEEERLATEFIREAAPKGMGIECFFMRNDYHNLKVLVKAKYTGSDYEEMILPDGNYSFNELKEKYENNKLVFVNSYMGDAVKNIERYFETNGVSPRKIDTEIDKAMYKEIAEELKKKEVDKYIKEYFTTVIDATNVGSLYRTITLGADWKFFEDNFIEGGEIAFETFKESGLDMAKLEKLVAGTKLKTMFVGVENGDLSRFETAKDNYLLTIFAANKGDMFSVAPIVGYYLGKLNEIKVIRVVLICLKNNVSAEEMKKRVRALYA